MMTLSSPAFKNKENIPLKYTCKGADVNPPLMITGVPERTISLALIVDDPDAPAGTWCHWVVWNIPPDTESIRENSLIPGSVQGVNDFKKHTYGGPCPPYGTHRYFFRLYALDAVLDLNEKTTEQSLLAAMKDHVIEQTELVGLFKKA